jgi:hypothetical protein
MVWLAGLGGRFLCFERFFFFNDKEFCLGPTTNQSATEVKGG